MESRPSQNLPGGCTGSADTESVGKITRVNAHEDLNFPDIGAPPNNKIPECYGISWVWDHYANRKQSILETILRELVGVVPSRC